MLDKITQAVLTFKGEVEVPEKHSFKHNSSAGMRNPILGYNILCTTENFGDRYVYVWASDDSGNALNPDRRICTLDEYLIHVRKVKEYLKFYGFTFDQPFDIKTWSVWNERQSKLEVVKNKKYWNGVSAPTVGETVKYFQAPELEVIRITKTGKFICFNEEKEFTVISHLKDLQPVKSKKDQTVDDICSKAGLVNHLGFVRIIVEKLYDLNLLKEID
jgi:hypothetical protein